MKFAPTLLTVLLLTVACATTRDYEKKLEAWKGQSADKLVRKWGMPQNVITLSDKTKVYEYRYMDGETQEKTSRALSTFDASCKTLFSVNEVGLITGWKWEGHNCRSK